MDLTLLELSKEYRESGELCRGRMREIERELEKGTATASERLLLRRRLTILSAMARDAIELSNKLGRYYEVNGRNNGDS